MRKRAIFKTFKQAVEAADIDLAGIKAMSVDAVRQMAGAEYGTSTVLKNMKKTMVAELQRKEVVATADWLVTSVQTRFANAEVRIRRGQMIEVWLDGLPKEIE